MATVGDSIFQTYHKLIVWKSKDVQKNSLFHIPPHKHHLQELLQNCSLQNCADQIADD